MIYYACLFHSSIIALSLIYLCDIILKLFLCHILGMFQCRYNAQIFLEYLWPKVTVFKFFEPYTKHVISLLNFSEKSLIPYCYSAEISIINVTIMSPSCQNIILH